jgi:magnesium transporter
MHKNKQIIYADDETESVFELLKLRLPWLVIGLLGGLVATRFIAHFEQLITSQVSLAYFLPLVVYLSDAVGTQTENIYVRNASKETTTFSTSMVKEIFIGIVFGLLFGGIIGLVAYFWVHNLLVALTVGLSLALCIAVAPVIALTTPFLIQAEHTDPALAAGPFTTIIQNLVAILIYFTIASFIMF